MTPAEARALAHAADQLKAWRDGDQQDGAELDRILDAIVAAREVTTESVLYDGASALIAAGRAYDEEISPAPWRDNYPSVTCECCRFADSTPGVIAGVVAQPADAAGIAWLRTNLGALLDLAERTTVPPAAIGTISTDDLAQLRHHVGSHRATAASSCSIIERLLEGYTAALDEVARIEALAQVSPDDVAAVVGQNDAVEADNARLREAFSQAIRSLSTDGTVRNAFCSWCDQRWPILDGESHEVVRQYANDHAQQCTAHPLLIERDRLLAELDRSRDMNRHYEQERDSWPLAYRQRAKQTDARIAELEGGLRDALVNWRYPPLTAVEKARKDEIWSLVHGDAATLRGAPCTEATKK